MLPHYHKKLWHQNYVIADVIAVVSNVIYRFVANLTDFLVVKE